MVIAVIAVLAALVLPALSQAKARRYSVKCKSKLHQMGLAPKMYVDEDAGHYPYYYCSISPGPLKWEDASRR